MGFEGWEEALKARSEAEVECYVVLRDILSACSDGLTDRLRERAEACTVKRFQADTEFRKITKALTQKAREPACA